jgi:hypothetical protein
LLLLSDDRALPITAGAHSVQATSLLRRLKLLGVATLVILAGSCTKKPQASTVVQLTLDHPGDRIPATDFKRLEQNLLALRGVTLVSVNAKRRLLTVHHGPDTDAKHIERMVRESGFTIQGASECFAPTAPPHQ